MDALLDDWRDFARTQLAATRVYSGEELENSARQLLEAVAADMRTEQTPAHRMERSRGERDCATPEIREYGKLHAAVRFDQGLTVEQLAAEYRALRASVLRHWAVETRHGKRDMRDIVRFNEGIDECLTESMAWYGRRMNEARALFLAALGHDLRNPLSAVLMSAQAILRNDQLDPNVARAADVVLHSSERMRGMLDDLLDFTTTRLGGRMQMRMTHGALDEALRYAVDELRAIHPEAQIFFECNGTLEGDWDAGRIAQLASNLVGNAIQYGDPGKPITVAARETPTEVILTVHNECEPIGADMLEKVFDPLTRGVAHKVEKPDGSHSVGLGLYIAREITEAHGGTIQVSSTAERGTTFTVRLLRASQLP